MPRFVEDGASLHLLLGLIEGRGTGMRDEAEPGPGQLEVLHLQILLLERSEGSLVFLLVWLGFVTLHTRTA